MLENALVWWSMWLWVLLGMPTKRCGLCIAYTPTRAADGSDGERAAWDATCPGMGKGLKLEVFKSASLGESWLCCSQHDPLGSL